MTVQHSVHRDFRVFNVLHNASLHQMTITIECVHVSFKIRCANILENYINALVIGDAGGNCSKILCHIIIGLIGTQRANPTVLCCVRSGDYRRESRTVVPTTLPPESIGTVSMGFSFYRWIRGYEDLGKRAALCHKRTLH